MFYAKGLHACFGVLLLARVRGLRLRGRSVFPAGERRCCRAAFRNLAPGSHSRHLVALCTGYCYLVGGPRGQARGSFAFAVAQSEAGRAVLEGHIPISAVRQARHRYGKGEFLGLAARRAGYRLGNRKAAHRLFQVPGRKARGAGPPGYGGRNMVRQCERACAAFVRRYIGAQLNVFHIAFPVCRAGNQLQLRVARHCARNIHLRARGHYQKAAALHRARESARQGRVFQVQRAALC